MLEYRNGNGNGKTNGAAVAHRPDRLFSPFQQLVDQFFQDSLWGPAPANRTWPQSRSFVAGWAAPAGTNLWETNDSYLLQIVMPGMKADSISCTVEQNLLNCRAEPAYPEPQGAQAVWQSFGGPVQYRIQLPAEVEGDHAQAAYNDGILTLTLPKAAHARVQTIKVVGK
jgi:HSP20 family protein